LCGKSDHRCSSTFSALFPGQLLLSSGQLLIALSLFLIVVFLALVACTILPYLEKAFFGVHMTRALVSCLLFFGSLLISSGPVVDHHPKYTTLTTQTRIEEVVRDLIWQEFLPLQRLPRCRPPCRRRFLANDHILRP